MFAPAGESGDICPAQLAVGVQSRSQPFDELRVTFACGAAQLMIEVADNEAPVSELVKPVEERHGIAAAGHANEVTAGRRKLRDDVGIEPEFLFWRRRHAVQQATA
jgi:hypothetical protein